MTSETFEIKVHEFESDGWAEKVASGRYTVTYALNYTGFHEQYGIPDPEPEIVTEVIKQFGGYVINPHTNIQPLNPDFPLPLPIHGVMSGWERLVVTVNEDG